MQMPEVHSLAEAKALVKSEKNKLWTATKAIAGSRILLAVFAATCITYGTHLVYARDRLPSLSGLTLASVGLPNVDFGLAGQAAQEAVDAAQRQGGAEVAQGFLAGHGALVPYFNFAGFALSFVLLVWALAIQTEKRKREAAAK